jgi:hypothetical protein
VRCGAEQSLPSRMGYSPDCWAAFLGYFTRGGSILLSLRDNGWIHPENRRAQCCSARAFGPFFVTTFVSAELKCTCFCARHVRETIWTNLCIGFGIARAGCLTPSILR